MAAKKTTARSPSPAKAAKEPKSAKKTPAAPRSAARKKKVEPAPEIEDKSAAAAVAVASSAEKKKKTPARKREPKQEIIDDEEITSVESDDTTAIFVLGEEDLNDETLVIFQDPFKDSRAIHNVIRIQYLQFYALGLALLGSAFTQAFAVIPLFAGTNGFVRAIAGAIALSQAFSLTAVAQTSFTPMKKTLQYNLVFQLLFAFAIIFKQAESSLSPTDVKIAVGVTLANIALNMWVVYFRNNDLVLDESDEEDDE